MQSFRQIGAGILLSAFSIVMVMGALMLALVEGGGRSTSGINIPTGAIIATLQILPASFTNTPQGISLPATASLTPPPTLANCPPPAGWLAIVVQPSDTLRSIAETYHSTVEILQKSNCLLNEVLIANSVIYVPAQPTATPRPCGAPANWGMYTVKQGDTLYAISLLYRVSWQELMQANCLDTSYIKTGQVLRVPNVAVSTVAAPSETLNPTETEAPEITLTPSIPTLTPSISTPTDEAPTPSETTPATNTEVPTATTVASETPLPAAPEITPTP